MNRLSTVRALFALQWMAACALALPAADALALDRERSLAQLHHTAWRARDGAPSQVWSLAQTTDGYLWIGTATGLFRFDGVTFERYVPDDGTQLPSNNIGALLATPDGGLWISFHVGPLALLREGSLRLYSREDELPPDTALAFALDHDGALWAGTNRGLAVREGDRWRVMGAAQGFPEGKLARLLGVDRGGTLWAASAGEVMFLPRGERTFRRTGDQVNHALQIAQAPDGRYWLAETSHSVRPLSLPDQAPPRDEDELLIASQSILFDSDGALWVTTLGKGLGRVSHPEKPGAADKMELFTQADGLSSDVIRVAFEDREGNLWFGTDKGIDRFRHGNVVPVTMPTGHRDFTLMAGDDGEIWAASASLQPLLRVRGDELTPQPEVHSILSAYRDDTGVIWWGSYDGIWRQHEGRFSLSGLPDNVRWGDWTLRNLHGDGAGGLWVGVVGQGFVHFRDGQWHGTSADHYPPGGTSAVFNDARGHIWLGKLPDRILRMRGKEVDTYGADAGLDIGRVAVIRGRGPHLWFAGDLGLALFRDGRFHRILADGDEPLGSISGLVESTAGELWLAEARGLIRIPAIEIERLLANPAHAVRYRRFDYLDGLPGAPQMNRSPATVVKASDGRLWFATDNGLAWIDPTRLHRNAMPPPVRVRAVDVDGLHLLPESALKMPVDAHQVRITYTAMSLAMPERVKFRYRLDGADRDWQEAGMRREAVYTNLGPGQYRFHVLAANEDGVWNEDGATLDFTIPPPFYRTAWFLVLCVAAGAALVWLLYRRRLQVMEARLQVRLEERHQERERIARELHDTLLQGIQGLILHFQSAVERLPAHEPARGALERALERADNVLDEGRDRVQGLRSTALPMDDLPRALAEAGAGLAGNPGPDFRIAVNGTPHALDPLVGDEIFGIAREALANAFHHAQAVAIAVELDYDVHALRLRIRDDGCGIDPEILDAGSRPGHWGLSGMRERAARIGAALEFRSGSGVASGTEVELRVPGRIAYPVLQAPWRNWVRRFAARGS